VIDFGFYLIGPGSYAHVPWEEGVAEVARAGFAAIDVSASGGVRAVDSSGFSDSDRRRLRSLAEEHGLGISAVVTHLGLADTIRQGAPLDLDGAVQVAVDLGSPLVLLHIGGPAAHPWTTADLWRTSLAHVRRACDRAAGNGIRIALDAVAPDFLTTTPLEVRRFLEEVDRPNIGWNLDPAYLSFYGFALDEAIELVGPWICHAHIKDHRGRPDDPPWLVPGDGELDHGAWARALRRLGLSGVVSAEVIARPKNMPERWPLSYACERSIATFRAAFDAASQPPQSGHLTNAEEP
jgi:sugar phosphate isomerase/epimerase